MFIPSKKQAEEITKKYGTPVFVTDAETIRLQAQKLLKVFKSFDIKIFYAIKANYNPSIMRIIKESGIYGIDAVSPNEIKLALDLGYKPSQIIFTPNSASDEEIKEVGSLGILQNLGSLSEIQRFCKFFPHNRISIRICPEVGAGEFDQIVTGPLDSKFGLELSDLAETRSICDADGVKIIGLHSHIGSGFYEASVFKKSVEAVCKVAKQFSDLQFLDFGGGFGVYYHPRKKPINLKKFALAIQEPLEKFNKARKKNIEIRIEPGKFLVSESTVLLARITTLKKKGDKTFVGLDTGFNHLIRPAMYDAYHHIVNLSKNDNLKNPQKIVQVVGNICETCDILNKEIKMADPQEGDLIAILVAGGYGTAMSSNYNMRNLAAEVLIRNKKIILTKRRQTYKEMMRLFNK